MSIRTIEAPGVEIKEIDRSAYTPVMTGTRAFVMGYANKGEPYIPMQFTSKTAWQQYYGEPDNEAERYFYNACSEVINQNGVLYCSRIPYDNASKGKMVGFKYNMGTIPQSNPNARTYLLENPVSQWVDHDDDFEKDALDYVISHKCYREIDDNLQDGFEEDTEIRKFYGYAIEAFNETYNKQLKYRRFSISYLSVDVEESQKIQKRFLSYDEALSYLKDFEGADRPGHYGYIIKQRCANGEYVKEPKYNILSDGGDWIAQPLFARYVKEATAKESFGGPVTFDTLGDLAAYVESEFKPQIGDDKWVEQTKVDDIKENLKTLIEIYESRSIDATIVKDLFDEVDNIDENSKLSIGDEIKVFGYLGKRKNEILSATVQLSVHDLYEKGYLCDNCNGNCDNTGCCEDYVEENADKTVATYTTYATYEIKVCNDGADNEFLFDTTVSALYNDTTMKLYEIDRVKSLYENELWIPYREMTLGQILKKKQQSAFKNYEEMITDKTYNISSWAAMLEIYKTEGDFNFSDIVRKYGVTDERIHDDVPFSDIADIDETFEHFLKITPSKLPISYDLSKIDEYRTGEDKVPSNSFVIVDKTCATLKNIQEDERKGEKRQMIGIFPVVTTVANALYAQSLINPPVDQISCYETVSGVVTKSPIEEGVVENTNSLLTKDVTKRFWQGEKTEEEISGGAAIDTVSREAANFFLPIQMRSDLSGVEKEHAKKIGVVVYKAYLDASEGNKVSFNVVEAFVGSLDRDDKNPNTGVSTFIDKIINTQSEYIYFFSNCFCSQADKRKYVNDVDFLVCELGHTGMLGFFESETKETISLPSLYQGMDKCLKNVEDINTLDIDIVPDAGLANIAQFMKSVWGEGAHEYDIEAIDEAGNPLVKAWKCQSSDDVKAWKTVLFKLDDFCKKTRHDCMFIADGPRPLVLQGQKKIVRTSKPDNTIDANILPYVKYATGLNTNYGAGYLNWFLVTDEFSGDEFWCPPSIKAMGVYINTDLNFEYWDAPAGLNRGIVQALDCAFSPTIKQAGSIYMKNWNYAINYPQDGIVLEGQKTFQVKPSAFDRVNVRRMFLRLERQAYRVAKYFVYEANTQYTRQRLIDMLDPLFRQAKIGGGIYDYLIICDESINTPEVIDNNELRVKIGIKPTKTAEFILIDFVALSTGGSFSEM